MIIRKTHYAPDDSLEGILISKPHPNPFLLRPPARAGIWSADAQHNGTWEVRNVGDLNEAAGFLHTGRRNRFCAAGERDPRAAFASADGRSVGVWRNGAPAGGKAFPYPPEEVTSDFEVIEQTENESVVSSVAVHNAKLHRTGRAAFQPRLYSAPGDGLCRAAGRVARRHGARPDHLSRRREARFARSAKTASSVSPARSMRTEAEQLQRDLPQLALSAELQGIDTSFPRSSSTKTVCRCATRSSGSSPSAPDLMGMETPPAAVEAGPRPGGLAQAACRTRQAKRNGANVSSGRAAPMPRPFCFSRSMS